MTHRNYMVSGKKLLLTDRGAFLKFCKEQSREFGISYETRKLDRGQRLNDRRVKKLFNKLQPSGINEKFWWNDYMRDVEATAHRGYF